MEPLKVLEITQASGGGVQKYVIQLCRHLDRHRFAVTGCCSVESLTDCPSGDVAFPLAFEEAAVPYFAVPMERSISPLKDLLALGMIYREIRTRRFDIVHAHSSKAGVLARIAARWAGVPAVIYSPHAFSFAAPAGGLRERFYVLLERAAARFGDSIVADSRGEKQLASAMRIAGAEDVAVIPPGVAAEDMQPRWMTRELRVRMRNSLNLDPHSAVITWVGRLAVQKDPATFIHAAELLTRTLPSITFLLVGDGPLREQCFSRIQIGAVRDTMKLLGWRRDCRDLLAISDIVVISSLYEGLPYILLEAMALGTPVVATAVSGNRDVIIAGENGLLVSPQSPPEMAESCLWLLQHPERAEQLGKAARCTVERSFSLEKMVSATEELYNRVYQKKSAGHG